MQKTNNVLKAMKTIIESQKLKIEELNEKVLDYYLEILFLKEKYGDDRKLSPPLSGISRLSPPIMTTTTKNNKKRKRPATPPPTQGTTKSRKKKNVVVVDHFLDNPITKELEEIEKQIQSMPMVKDAYIRNVSP